MFAFPSNKVTEWLFLCVYDVFFLRFHFNGLVFSVETACIFDVIAMRFQQNKIADYQLRIY